MTIRLTTKIGFSRDERYTNRLRIGTGPNVEMNKEMGQDERKVRKVSKGRVFVRNYS